MTGKSSKMLQEEDNWVGDARCLHNSVRGSSLCMVCWSGSRPQISSQGLSTVSHRVLTRIQLNMASIRSQSKSKLSDQSSRPQSSAQHCRAQHASVTVSMHSWQSAYTAISKHGIETCKDHCSDGKMPIWQQTLIVYARNKQAFSLLEP